LATGPSTIFDLQMKQQGTATYQTTDVSRIFLHIYFISPCSRPASTACAASDDGIPTLKRLDLGAGSFQMVTIAEGIEDMNIEYGIDSDRDGSADGAFIDNPTTVTAWWDVTAVRVNLLARNNQATPGYQESKQFDLGVGRTAISFTGANAGFKRHVYSELVRVNNVSMRRE
jgi:type IV pilus assembly protein PilW